MARSGQTREEAASPKGSEPDEIIRDLTNRFWDRLRFFAMRRLRDRGLAEDVAQETLRRTLEALRGGRIENPAALPSFLFETARNVCMHRMRSAGREARAFERLGPPGEEPHGFDDPLGDLISDERRQAVRDALARLGDSDRGLLQMSYVESIETVEIAQRLGLTPGAVRVRRHRALERLAEILGVTRGADREL